MTALVLLISCATKLIVGQVVENQMPISGVTCSFLEHNIITDSSGRFVFDDLSVHKGPYSIKCIKDGYQFIEESHLISGRTVQLPPMPMQTINVEIPYLEINLDPNSSLKESRR